MRYALPWVALLSGLFASALVRGDGFQPGEDSVRQANAGDEKPNVVLIFVDDMGCGQVSCYPQADDRFQTPNIDRIAETGIRATDGYSAHPMCWPSRASLLTGRYYQRFLRGVVVPDSETMIPAYLKTVGYATGCIGKWHNTGSIGEWDGQEKNHPRGWGFDRFFGFLGGMHDYWDPDLGTHFKQGKNRPHRMPIYDDTARVEKVKYLTDEFTDRAVEFIERHHERPFFLYLSYNAIHTPFQAPQPLIKKHEGDVAAAMVASLDIGVGRVLNELTTRGLRDRTMVLFIGDNGGYPGTNGELRASKSRLFEGGIRVPFLGAWPGRLPAGETYSQPVMHIDVMPTLLAAAGVEIPENVDGENLLPHWQGKRSDPPHQVLFWGDPGRDRFAVRRCDWKLVCESDQRQGEPVLGLYDLEEDVSEQHNVLEQQPHVAAELKGLRAQWSKDVSASRRALKEP
jgi:arylsulfatase A-like enzyme